MKTLNKILISIIILFALITCLIIKVNFFKYLSIIPIILIPTILRILFKIKFNYIIETLLIIFIFISYYIGYVLKVYQFVIGYDKLIHFISGIIFSLIAFYILKINKKYNNKNKWFNILFCISFSLAIGVLWEFVEFNNDKIFHRNDQSAIDTGVDDTMYDLLMAFISSIIFCIFYYYEVTFKKELFIKKYIKKLD